MRKTMLAALLVVLAAAPSSTATAQSDPDEGERPGPDIAARVGYAIPFGASNPLSSEVPFIFEVGYHLDSALTVGGVFQYALAQVHDDFGCGMGAACSGSIVRFGLEALYHVRLESPFVPWLGIGSGYEWMRLDLSGTSGAGTVRAQGFELVTAQAGVDVLVRGPLFVGPFVSFSVARYDAVAVEQGGIATPDDVGKTHTWLQFGLRGRLKL